MDSHREVIENMVDVHGCNMTLKDMHGKSAYDELITKRGRPGSPTGTDLRERMITEQRDELLEDRTKDRADLKAAARPESDGEVGTSLHGASSTAERGRN